MSDPVPHDFRGEFRLDAPTRWSYATAEGVLRLEPRAVAVPCDAADVVALARWATTTGTPLVPRAAGTGRPGGNVGAGVVVDLRREFRALGEPDAARRCVRVQPGVTREELNQRCAPLGLHLPVDPSSGRRCTLGGMIAANAAGAHSVRHGATRAWVEALEVVLSDGSRGWLRRGEPPAHPRLREIRQRLDALLRPAREAIVAAWPRVRKNSSGYALREYLQSGDLLDLVVGSEGTLALVVDVELRLAPRPAACVLALLEFTSLEAAGAAVQTLLPLGVATCEMLDRTFIELVRAAGVEVAYPLRPGLEAILLVELEGESEPEVGERMAGLERALRGVADRISLARDAQQRHRFWEVRHAASPLIAQRTDGRVSMQLIEDGVVPVERLPDYVRALRRILDAHGVPAVIFGHAGDANLHVNPLLDVHAPDWRQTAESIVGQVSEAVAALGGTLAGEHGDGRLRAPLLELVWGAEMVRRFRQVKEVFDPRGLLNPGVVLPLPGQRPLDALRSYPLSD